DVLQREPRGGRARAPPVTGPERPARRRRLVRRRGRVARRRPCHRPGRGLMPPLAAPHTLVRDARSALERGRGHLLGLQHPEGWWWGELESNATITAEHMFLLSMLGLATAEHRSKI